MNIVIIQYYSIYTSGQNAFERSLLHSARLHLFDQKYSKTVILWDIYNLKELNIFFQYISIYSIYFEMQVIRVMAKLLSSHYIIQIENSCFKL